MTIMKNIFLMLLLLATLAGAACKGTPAPQEQDAGGQAAAGIALILGVDRILDMLRTVTNVTGDLSAAVIVARSEGETLYPHPVEHPVALGPEARVEPADALPRE